MVIAMLMLLLTSRLMPSGQHCLLEWDMYKSANMMMLMVMMRNKRRKWSWWWRWHWITLQTKTALSEPQEGSYSPARYTSHVTHHTLHITRYTSHVTHDALTHKSQYYAYSPAKMTPPPRKLEPAPICRIWVLGFGFWVLGFGFWVLGFGFWVLGFEFWVLGFGLRA